MAIYLILVLFELEEVREKQREREREREREESTGPEIFLNGWDWTLFIFAFKSPPKDSPPEGYRPPMVLMTDRREEGY